MKKPSLFAAMAALVLVTGCETPGTGSARVRENSATYAGLKTWEKRYIDKGVIAAGFTPEMVYMAIGRPSKKEKQPPPGTGELWVFENYYPAPDAHYSRKDPVAAQPGVTGAMGDDSNSLTGPRVGGISPKPGSRPPGIAQTGGPQGGSMEPTGPQSYTLFVLFADGKVSKVSQASN